MADTKQLASAIFVFEADLITLQALIPRTNLDSGFIYISLLLLIT